MGHLWGEGACGGGSQGESWGWWEGDEMPQLLQSDGFQIILLNFVDRFDRFDRPNKMRKPRRRRSISSLVRCCWLSFPDYLARLCSHGALLQLCFRGGWWGKGSGRDEVQNGRGCKRKRCCIRGFVSQLRDRCNCTVRYPPFHAWLNTLLTSPCLSLTLSQRAGSTCRRGRERETKSCVGDSAKRDRYWEISRGGSWVPLSNMPMQIVHQIDSNMLMRNCHRLFLYAQAKWQRLVRLVRERMFQVALVSHYTAVEHAAGS